MPPAARRSTAAICRPRPGRKTRKAADRPGRTRCLKTTPSSAWASGLTVDKQTQYARELLLKLSGEIGESMANDLLNAPQADEADLFEQRQRVAELKKRLAGIALRRCGQPAEHRRRAGQEIGVARGRRRLGLRHRLRRARPRARFRPQRQHPGARHRGLFEHRRPGFESHAARRPSPNSPPTARNPPRKTSACWQ